MKKVLQFLKECQKDINDFIESFDECSCDEDLYNAKITKLKINEAIKELEFYLNKRNSYPPCDTCGKEVDYMPWHYSTEKERHLHSCDKCWVSIKDKLTLKESK